MEDFPDASSDATPDKDKDIALDTQPIPGGQDDFPAVPASNNTNQISVSSLEGTDSLDVLTRRISNAGLASNPGPIPYDALISNAGLTLDIPVRSPAMRRLQRRNSSSPQSLFGKLPTPRKERRDSFNHVLGGSATKRHKHIKTNSKHGHHHHHHHRHHGRIKFPKETVATRAANGKFTIHLLRQFAIPDFVPPGTMPPPATKYDVTISEIWGVDETHKALARLVKETETDDTSVIYVKAEKGANKLGILIPSEKLRILQRSSEFVGDDLLNRTVRDWCRIQTAGANTPLASRSGKLLRDVLQHADGTGRLIIRFCYAIANKLRCQPPSVFGLAPKLCLEGIDEPIPVVQKEKKRRPKKKKAKPKAFVPHHVGKAHQHAFATKIQACVRAWFIAPVKLVSAGKISSVARVRQWNAQVWQFPEARRFQMAKFRRLRLRRRQGDKDVPAMTKFEAAMDIQRMTRAFLARKRLRKLIGAVTKIQAWLRAIWFYREAKARWLLFMTAVKRLQRWVRNWQKPVASVWEVHTPSANGTRRGSLVLQRSIQKQKRKKRLVGISGNIDKPLGGQWTLRAQVGKKRHKSRIYFY